MGRAKEILYYNGRYKGKLLSDEECDKLEILRNIDEEHGFIKDLKHSIFDLPEESVNLILSTESGEFLQDKEIGTLSNIQTTGVAYMYFAKNLVLGDSVGIGKTVEVCSLCNLLENSFSKIGKEFRFLYLTSKNLILQAQKEFIRFSGNFVYPLYGEKRFIDKFTAKNSDRLNYSIVGAHSLINSVHFQEYLINYRRTHDENAFNILIIDEAGDLLTNSTTKTYKNAKQIRNMFERCVLLNATSFEKELGMFYNQISFVDETLLPPKYQFSKEYEIMDYTGPYPVFSGKYKNAEKFKELVGYRYYARTRKSTGATMTNCTADVIVSPLSPEQKELLRKTSMPHMVYDCPSYFGTGIETNEETTPKLDSLINLLSGDLRDEKSILIYARYKEAQRSIYDILTGDYSFNAYVLNGDSPQDEREAAIECFKKGEINILITNVQKGLNFGNCNHCIFYDYDPNPNKMVQFEGRMTRSYNIDNKHVYLLISRGKELSTFKRIISDRAKASDIFAGSDFSCVLSILLNDNKINDLK